MFAERLERTAETSSQAPSGFTQVTNSAVVIGERIADRMSDLRRILTLEMALRRLYKMVERYSHFP